MCAQELFKKTAKDEDYAWKEVKARLLSSTFF